MKKLSMFLAAAVAAVSLTGCSGSGRPAGCDAPTDVDLSGSLKSEAAYFEELNKPFGSTTFAFSIIDREVMMYPNCFSPDYVAGFEEAAKQKANWDGDPNYGAEPAFLPIGNLTDSQTAAEIELSDDASVLSKAFNTVLSKVEEGDGTYTDYSVELGTVGSSIQLGADSGRQRDITNLSLGLTFEARVDMDGQVDMWIAAHFDARDAEGTQLGLEGLCNGLLFEAGGEAFKIPSPDQCGFLEPSDSGFYFDYWIMSYSDYEELGRMMRVLATGPFSVFLVDAEGANHQFDYPAKAAKEVAKYALIVKAIESGYGY